MSPVHRHAFRPDMIDTRVVQLLTGTCQILRTRVPSWNRHIQSIAFHHMECAFRFLDQCSPIASSRQGLIHKVTMLFIAYFRSEAEAIIHFPLLVKIATPFHLAGWFELFGHKKLRRLHEQP